MLHLARQGPPALIVCVAPMCRCLLLSIAHVHFSVVRFVSFRAKSSSARVSHLLVRIVLACLANIIAMVFVTCMWDTAIFDTVGEWDWDMLGDSDLMNCLMQVNRNASCLNNANLSWVPSNFVRKEFTQYTAEEVTRWFGWSQNITKPTYMPWNATINFPPYGDAYSFTNLNSEPNW